MNCNVLTSTCTAKTWNLTGIQLYIHWGKRMPYLKTRTDHVDMEKGNNYVNNTSEIKDWVAGIHLKSTEYVITLRKYSCLVLNAKQIFFFKARYYLYLEYHHKNKDGKKHSNDLIKIPYWQHRKERLAHIMKQYFPPSHDMTFLLSLIISVEIGHSI